jgi:hypothetical protein
VVNLSMNQVLARSINTSLVAILPILSILVIGAWVLGATALEDFGLALFVGLTTGAYSSIFIASPTLALLKEREPRYAEIRRRLASSTAGSKRISPAAAAHGDLSGAVALAPAGGASSGRRVGRAAAPAPAEPAGPGDGSTPIPAAPTPQAEPAEPEVDDAPAAGTPQPASAAPAVPPRAGNRPPPRPRKKGRRR